MIGSRAWWALMRRNFIYRKRNWLGTLFEMALPICFMAILLAIKNAVKNNEDFQSETIEPVIPAVGYTALSFQDYVTAMQATRQCVLNITGEPEFWISGIPDQGDNWQVPFVKCDSRNCQEDGEDAQQYCTYSIIGVSGSDVNDVGGQTRAADFTTWLYKEYPALTDNMPFNFSFVRNFTKPQEMDDYVKDQDYGKSGFPKLVMGIVWKGNDTTAYIYSLRQNSTNFNAPESQWRPATRTTPDTEKLFESYAKDDFDVCLRDDGAAEQGRFQESCTGQYLYNGVLTFQRLVGDFILEDTEARGKGYFVAQSGVSFVPFPTKAYEEDGFYGDLGPAGALLATLGLLYPVAAMIGYITREKEKGEKELMKTMSVTESDIGWSWFVTFFLFNIITASITTGVSMALYENSKGIYLWLFWLFTFLAITVFAMFLSTLTSKSTRAVMIGLLLFFIGVFLTFAVEFDDGSSSLIALISLHPVAAFSYGLQEIGRLEDQGVGLQSSTVGSTDSPSDYTFNMSIQFLLIDSVIWGVLAWYLNRVIKQDYGQSLPLWFPFSRSYWSPSTAHPPLTDIDLLEQEYHSSMPFEVMGRRQADEGNDIEIHGLRKVFAKTHAVDGLSLTMYSGQVTALLGHNGAGKTTTINMLTGGLAPTDGYARIAGKDIRTHVPQIRNDLGICPQHNCLFDQLTVREHLQFFSRLKGLYSQMSYEEAEQHVDQALQDIALLEKRNTLAKKLSGGMKRKLSVAIAFCGGSSIVLLDEPTSGMDPFSRRFTWNVIRQYRENRCIILTTHFMDEADVLGDRIAIMSHGQLRCVGSPLFLKKAYGVGYELTIEKKAIAVDNLQEKAKEEKKTDEQVDDDDITETTSHQDIDHTLSEIVRSAVPEATLLNNGITEMTYQLPMGAASHFGPMFAGLDGEVGKGNIFSYGVSITTLDEVFLAVARGDIKEKGELSSSMLDLGSQTLLTNLSDDRSTRSAMDLEENGLFYRHLRALFRKRCANFRRDKKAWLCTTILPSLFVLIGFIILTYAALDRDLDPVVLTLSDYNDGSPSPRNPIVFNSPDSLYTCQPEVCAYHFPVMNSTVTDELYFFCGYEARLDAGENCSITESADIMGRIDDAGAAPQGTDVETLYESSLSLSRYWDTPYLFAASQYGAIFFTHDTSSVIENGTSYNETVVEECILNQGNYTSVEDCSDFGGIGYVIQYNFTALHVTPLYQVLADEALVRESLNNSNFNIECTIDPLPITAYENSYGKADDAFMLWFLVVLSFPFIMGAFAVFVVAERESKAKHLQTVAGVEPSAYWISTFLWDIMNYQIPLWITVILMFAFDVDVLTTTERGIVGGVIVLLFLFGPAAASFSYCVSFAFETPSMANIFLIISGFLIGLGGPIAVWMIHIFGEAGDGEDKNESLLDVATIITWILRFHPSFCLGKGLYNTIYIEAYDFWEGERITVWSEPILQVEVIFLACEAVLYLALAIYIDKWSTNPRLVSIWRKLIRIVTCRCCCADHNESGGDITTALPDDDDVVNEQDRVLEGRANSDLVVMSDLTKVYDDGKLAVNRMSLGIPHGECFGLLGINGAGKTTTLQVLTAEFPPTSGDATLAGFSVRSEPEKTRRRIGYCPQFDAHFDNMTGREHVELYASIKGIPKEHVKEAVLAHLRKVGLGAADSDRLSAEYSGGMKRRLSLACALIGEPQILFLDECTTGVDPVARREIWQVIIDMVASTSRPIEEKPSVILTTHSMEECEALCPRIGIMANGRLRCLGSAQHLKNKFGQGFQIELKVNVIDRADTDYVANAVSLDPSKVNPGDEERATTPPEDVFFNLNEAVAALQSLTADSFLSSMVNPENPAGYSIWKDAASPTGCPLDELAAFATTELRMRNVEDFMKSTYPGFVLRERQDSKVRYEIPSEGSRISSIFASIEENKDQLRISDYGVSQTSLEQVFNMHAAEAERLKQGRNDG